MTPKETAENSLLTSILDNTFPTGTSLPSERVLAKQLGVTRPTLREILQRLAREGWVTIQHGKPTMVNDFWQEGGLGMLGTLSRFGDYFPEGFLTNLLEVRVKLIPACARAAAETFPDILLNHLRHASDMGDDPEAFAVYDWELQLLMVRYSGNFIYPLILNDFFELYKKLGAAYFSFEKAREASASYYADLAQAIHQGGEEVEAVVKDVMCRTIDIWRELKIYQNNELKKQIAENRLKGIAGQIIRPTGSDPYERDNVLKMLFADLDKNWDIIIVGGGITGAGIFREAVRIGLKVLLLEQKDFAWGTSSRSSKMVHGGLRYLKEGKFMLTRISVKERERLLKEAPGLVSPKEFLVPIYSDHGPGRGAFELGLSIYGLMAYEKQHNYLDTEDFLNLEPMINPENLVGGFQYLDSQVDDARLVLRLINEGIAYGGSAVNYVKVTEVLRDQNGDVAGVSAAESDAGASRTFSSKVVINATGPAAEAFHPSPKSNLHLRPLRGSHLIFPTSALPVSRPISFFNPSDNRAIFAAPWEGATLFGTTDIDHDHDLGKEPVTSKEEVVYLMDAMHHFFPSLDISLKDCISTQAGVRPVLSEGKLEPSKESREDVIWVDKGLVTVTGGKLTTFRKMALDTLKAASHFLSLDLKPNNRSPVFVKVRPEMPAGNKLSPAQWRRLQGRYGEGVKDLIAMCGPEDLTMIPGTPALWAELPFAARYEQVKHLSDLLLRRVRIGLVMPRGGREYLDRIQQLCSTILPWDGARWEAEKRAYLELLHHAHSVPD